MIITSWNVRGLNRRGKQRYLKERLRRDKLSIMVIQETKITELKLKEILSIYKPHYEVVPQDARGSVGCLAILWNSAKIIFEDWVSLP